MDRPYKRSKSGVSRSRKLAMKARPRTKYSKPKYSNLNPVKRGPELKLVEGSGASLFQAAGGVQVLNAPKQGAGVNERIGNRIEMKTLRIRMSVGWNNGGFAAATNDNYPCRAMVFYDRQANTAIPNLATLLGSWAAAASTNTYTSVLNGINASFRDRFVVLVDEVINVPTSTWSGGFSQGNPITFETAPDGRSTTTYVDRFVKLKNLTTHYVSGSVGANISDIASGSLVLMLLAGDASVVSPQTCPIELLWNSRVVYRDIQ